MANKTDEAWIAYGRIRALAARTGDPEVQALADEFHAKLMGRLVRLDRYGTESGGNMCTAHDSAAPITRPRIVEDRYAAYRG
jgi:hypothetical protein